MNRAPDIIVSVDQVAMLRASRSSREPDPIHFALQAEMAGAAGVRAHLRIDQKNISEEDVTLLNRLTKTRFFLQVSPHQDVLHLVNGLRPQNLILAAERRDEKMDMGLDVILLAGELKGMLANVDTAQTRIFLFVDPQLDQIKMAAKLGVRGVLINAREFFVDQDSGLAARKLDRLKDAARLSGKFGLETHLAGGIIAEKLPLVAGIPGVAALHLGHELVARSLMMGVSSAVESYLSRIERITAARA